MNLFASFKTVDYPPIDLPPVGSDANEILQRWRRYNERCELVYSTNIAAIKRRGKAMNALIFALATVNCIPAVIAIMRHL